MVFTTLPRKDGHLIRIETGLNVGNFWNTIGVKKVEDSTYKNVT